MKSIPDSEPRARLLISAPTQTPPALTAVVKALGDWKTAEVTVIADFEKLGYAALLAGDSRPIFVVVAISANKDLLDLTKFLDVVRPRLGKREVTVVCLNAIDHPKVPYVLKSKGCAEVLGPECTAKLLARKVGMGVENLLRMTQAAAVNRAGYGTGSPLSARKAGPVAKEATFVEPLALDSDCWLIDDAKPIRCVMGRWSIAILGPGPSAGRWQPFQTAAQGAAWEWVPKVENGENPFVSDPGRWVYEGREPEFDWKANVWRVMSQKPSFYFLAGGGVALPRIQTVPAGLQIARNSHAAEAKREAILKSIDISMRIRQDELASGRSLELADELMPEKRRDGVFAAEAALGWNQGDLRPTAGREMGIGDLSSENEIGGRGIGMGIGGAKGYRYGEADYASGADAFKRVVLSITFPELSARGELIEMDEKNCWIDVSPESPLAVGRELGASMILLETRAGATATASLPVEIRLRVVDVSAPNGDSVLARFAIDLEGYRSINALLDFFREKQAKADQFLKQARGF